MPVNIANLSIAITANAAGAVNTFAQTKGIAESFASSISGIKVNFGGNEALSRLTAFSTAFSASLAGIGTLVSTAAAGFNFVEGLSKKAADFEMMAVRMEVMAGSAQKSKVLLDGIRDIGFKSLIPNENMLEATNRLLAYGVAQKDVLNLVAKMGDLSGGDAEHFNRIALAIGQAAGKGRLMGQEINQLNEVEFPALKIISEQTGIAMDQLMKASENGSVKFEHLTAAVTAATEAGGKWHDMQKKLSQTLSGQRALRDEQWDLLGRNAGQLWNNVWDGKAPGMDGMDAGILQGMFGQWSIGSMNETLGRINGTNMPDIGGAGALFKTNKSWADIAKEITGDSDAAEMAKKMAQMNAQGKALAESLQTAGEKFTANISTAVELFDAGAINIQTYDRAVAAATNEYVKQKGLVDSIKQSQTTLTPLLSASSTAAFTAIAKAREGQANSRNDQAEVRRTNEKLEQVKGLLKEMIRKIEKGEKITLEEHSL